jgi:ankyrin repeat protein
MPNVISNCESTWHYIRSEDTTGLAKALSERKASPFDVDEDGMSLLFHAVLECQYETYSYLLRRRADPYWRNSKGLMACAPGLERVLCGACPSETLRWEHLFLNSQIIEQQDFTTIHQVILGLNHHGLALQSVLDCGDVDIDDPDTHGRTPLIWAAMKGDVYSLDLLLEHGAAWIRRNAKAIPPWQRQWLGIDLPASRSSYKQGLRPTPQPCSVTSLFTWHV